MAGGTTAVRRVRLVVAAWLSAYLPRLTERRPRVKTDVAVWLPSWGLRLALGALALACAFSVVGGPLSGILLVGLAAAVVVWPSGVAPAAVVVVIAVVIAAGGPGNDWVQTALVLLGLHALAQWALLVGRTSWTAKIEVGALLAPLPRFLGIQAFVQPLAVLGSWLAGRTSGLDVLPLLAVLGLALVAYLWLPRLGERAR